ncbi:MAG: DUF1549 domain-containing protein [Pirellulaceae bacterium]
MIRSVPRITVLLLRLVAGLAALPGCVASVAFAQEPVDFAHQVLPVLQARCAECHSNGVFKGGLSLETRSDLLESGAVEPGSREASEIWSRITSDDPDLRMPPEGEPIADDEIEAIGLWIDGGLDWPEELSLAKSRSTRSLELSRPPVDKDMGHPIDSLIAGYFRERQVDAPALLEDHLFIRRVKLDLLGLLPTADETAAFVESIDPDKHQQLIDKFLSRDRDYADHWMSFWNDLLRNDYAGTGYIDGGRQQITGWLHRSLTENKSYDQFVRELINPSPEAEGFIKGIKWRGEVNASQIQPLQFSQNISQVFLGINMKCASCHDSFIDDWKLTDAYGLAAIVSEPPLEMHRCDVPTGKIADSKFVFPTVGQIDGALPRAERLTQLANLMTSPTNGRFPRTIVNRLWQRLAGRGLVHPVDVMAGEAWSEALLDGLATHLVEHDYDLKQTLRLIVTSKVYRGASFPAPEPLTSEPYVFRGIQAKRMTAEQFVDSIWQLTDGWPDQMNAAIELDVESAPAPIRAALVNSNAFMRSLGRPNREQVVTTRPAELSTLQALDLSNGEILANWLRQGAEYWLARQEREKWTDDQLINQLFLAALSRRPRESESELLSPDRSRDAAQQVEDILWIIIMLPEFQLID